MKPVSVPGTPIPLKVAAQNDPEIKAYMDGVASGTVKLQAPCDAMFNKPSDEDERHVDAVLEKIFGK